MSAANEKVSTVGIRNQVTLPKIIREGVNIEKKIQAYIWSLDKEDSLVISLETPSSGTTFNKIKISEKGQLVIPKNLRESKGIKEGTNLVFTVTKEKEIKVQKLLKKRKAQETNWRWNFLVEIIGALEGVAGLKSLDIKDNSLVINLKKDPKSLENELMEMLSKIENLLGTRLLIEKLEGNKIKLTPLT